ncbi:Kef-type K+ transport system membrane component [Gaiella occulta]|uniref:Kef-type K+ transport system membrane component n=1 Tax=Gaiella occulta TaxID=1002870 RepID=A0A7M2YTK3_9ACTN|nr:cation:proton antiporter [Gaiella occulta]RDI73482.1 Kef-type K+ transport system membrane component [Gaiella occulta]
MTGDNGRVTLAELSITIALLGGLGLVASRFGLSAIPAYLLAGIILGPHEPKVLSLVQPSDVTAFAAEIGLIFLLFFLGLEFSVERLVRSGRHVGLGGALDLVVNAGLGLLVGVATFGVSFAAVVLAACIYVSSSAIAVKALIDFRRLADDETDLVLAILLFEDIAIAAVLGFVATGGGSLGSTAGVGATALAFVGASLVVSRLLGPAIGRLLGRLELELFLIAVFGFVIGMSALAKELDLSEAVGALMAGVVLSDSGVREDIERRFFALRDVFGALFFFAFALTIDVAKIGEVGWIVLAALLLTLVGKVGVGFLAGKLGGLSPRRSLNAGAALVAHGEFTIILAQLAAGNLALTLSQRGDIAAFAGLYVLVTATAGVVLMKESKALGRRLLPARA